MNRPSVRFTTEAARLISLLHPETRRMIRLAIDELRKNPMLGDDLQEELSGFKSFDILPALKGEDSKSS